MPHYNSTITTTTTTTTTVTTTTTTTNLVLVHLPSVPESLQVWLTLPNRTCEIYKAASYKPGALPVAKPTSSLHSVEELFTPTPLVVLSRRYLQYIYRLSPLGDTEINGFFGQKGPISLTDSNQIWQTLRWDQDTSTVKFSRVQNSPNSKNFDFSSKF